jgi:hypothetical protein
MPKQGKSKPYQVSVGLFKGSSADRCSKELWDMMSAIHPMGKAKSTDGKDHAARGYSVPYAFTCSLFPGEVCCGAFLHSSKNEEGYHVRIARVTVFPKYQGCGIFTRCTHMLGAHVTSKTCNYKSGMKKNRRADGSYAACPKQRQLRISTHTGAVQDVLAKGTVFKYLGKAGKGKYGGSGTAGVSRSFKYHGLCDESFVAADMHTKELNKRIMYGVRCVDPKSAPGVKQLFQPTNWGPLTSTISNCQKCGKRKQFLANDKPCVCLTCKV